MFTNHSIIENKSNLSTKALSAKGANVVFSTKKQNVISQDSKLIPVHAARIGVFKGYRDGEFQLTTEMFKEIVDNFNSEKTPIACYRGHADLVGSINGEEPENCGWVVSLAVKDNNLWALCEFTQEMLEQLKQGKYKFASIYMKSNDVHRETGKEIGCRLVSLAITAQPFIDGLNSIALSQNNLQPSIYIDKTNDANKESLQMKKDKTKTKEEMTLVQNSEVEQAIESADIMEQMQGAKTMDTQESEIADKNLEELLQDEEASFAETVNEVDVAPMIEEARIALMPDSSKEEFVKYLIEVATNLKTSESEIEKEKPEIEVELSAETVMQDEAKEIKEVEEVAASSNVAALSANIKALNSIVATLRSENETLKKEVEEHQTIALSATINDSVSKGYILDSEKQIFTELAKSNKKLFDEFIETRKQSPKVVLSAIAKNTSDDKSKQVSVQIKSLSTLEQRILKGAGIEKK